MRICPICTQETSLSDVCCGMCCFPCFPMFFGVYELFPDPKPNEPKFTTVAVDPPKQCAICLDDIHTGYRLDRCKHMYHRECILEWHNKSQTCPVCRGGIE